MEKSIPTESELSELVEAALLVIKQHDKGLLQQKSPFDSYSIADLRALLLKHFGAGTRCYATKSHTFFTHPGRKVLIFNGDCHHFVSEEDWTVDPNVCVEVRVETGAAKFTKAQIDVLRQWCSEIP